MPGGNLASMESSDKQGVLDKYFYSYNKVGLIDGIDRNRRGLDKVSGRYEYSYDAIGRLTKTTHDGITKASYEYDAFGNRIAMSEMSADMSENIKTAYTYDVLDRLVEAKELNNSQAIHKTYDYDKRGNQTKEFIDGLLQKTFTFDATNMLSKVVDKDKGEFENQYNGLGFRVASTRPEERIDYLCDLSKDYYNLLERTVNGETESFVYDNNVISMSKSGNNYYYFQDELGSPMYMTGTDGVAVSSYAFDDFGRNIDPFTGKVRNNRNHNASKHAYTTNGNIIQPFAFTGYQEDEVSGLKFAQARYYKAEVGRFQSEDNVKGFIDRPFTLNHYGYCFGNPIVLVDNDGNWAKWVTKAANAVGDFYSDHKEIINATAITAAAVGITVVTGGAGAGLAVGVLSLAGGTAFGVNAAINGESFEKGAARGMADTAVLIGSFAANPGGAVLGFGGQVFTDVVNGQISSPETYAAATFGGAIANSGIPLQNTVGGLAGSLMNDMLANAVTEDKVSINEMIRKAKWGAIVGAAFDGGAALLKGFVPGNVNAMREVLKNPLWFLREFDPRSMGTIIDDIGRAAFGINGGSNIIMNYLDVLFTGKAQECLD